MKIYRQAALAALSLLTLTACSRDSSSAENSAADTVPVTESVTDAAEDDGIKGQTICWLADYDLNPANTTDGRSAALSLFEDVYGGKVEWIKTTPENRYSELSRRVLAGEPVDMFPYSADCVPCGIISGQFEALDGYSDILDTDSELWDSMAAVTDALRFDGKCYVLPYSLSSPQLLTYSRQVLQDEGLPDPYELYQNGTWDWNAFMDMMRKFTANADGAVRYGIGGDFGLTLLRSTGHAVVTYENGVLKNNINDAGITKAEQLMQTIADENLFRSDWNKSFPNDHSTLFFAMSDWQLGESNASNPGAYLMAVPFPKSPDADKNYISCDINAKMLVKNSDKGKAVAAYIKCERLAAQSDKLAEAAKQQALVQKKSNQGDVTSFVSEEQYNAVQSYLTAESSVPAVDFGFGISRRMSTFSDEERGVMEKLGSSLLLGSTVPESGEKYTWETLRESCSKTIDEELAKLK